MKTPDATVVQPDACPVPTFYGECLPNGFLDLDPNGTWQATGSSTTTLEMGSAMTTNFSQQLTIERMGCTGTISPLYPAAQKRADDSVIEYRCDPGVCPRTTGQMYVCVRASDHALIYVSHDSHTSTMPGSYYWTSSTLAVLTPVQ